MTYDHKKKGIMSCYKAMQTDLMLYNTLTEKVKILREKSCKGNCFEYPFKFGSSKHKDVVKKKTRINHYWYEKLRELGPERLQLMS